MTELMYVPKELIIEWIEKLPDKRRIIERDPTLCSRVRNIYSDSGPITDLSLARESMEEGEDEISENNLQDSIKEEDKDKDRISNGENESNTLE